MVGNHIIIAWSWNLAHTSTLATSYVCREYRVWPELNGSVAPPTNFHKPWWWYLHIHAILKACSTLDGQLCCVMRVARRPTSTPTCACARAWSSLLATLIFSCIFKQLILKCSYLYIDFTAYSVRMSAWQYLISLFHSLHFSSKLVQTTSVSILICAAFFCFSGSVYSLVVMSFPAALGSAALKQNVFATLSGVVS